MLDFRIHTFLTVCECMNFTKAAELLHITQPAVSQHIRYLETLYHVKLFTYENKKLRLTPAGELLLNAATALKNDELFVREQLALLPGQGLSLRFGTTLTIGESVISIPLARYLNRHPEDNISLIISNTDDLLKRLHSGDIHFALVEGNYGAEEYESLIYQTEPFVPVCHAEHSFKKEPMQLKDLLGERILIREPGSGTRDILEKMLDLRNIRLTSFTHVTEIGSMHVILELLSRDLGISFLYRTAVKKELESGHLRELKLRDFQIEHDFAFIWNKGSIYGELYKGIFDELN